MDKDQIRQTLSGYRPDLYQDDDPVISASLEAAKADTDLNAWLESEIAFDREFSLALSSVKPPREAKEKLLRLHANADDQPPSILAGPTTPKRSPIYKFGAIAALLIFSAILTGKYFLFPAPVEFTAHSSPTEETFREQMAWFASQRFVLDKRFDTNSASANWLRDNHFPAPQSIPGKLVRFQGMGCKKIDWQGQKVGLICFKNEDNEIVHLFIVDRAAISHDPDAARAYDEAFVFHDRETKGWKDDNRLYLLVGSEPGVLVSGLM